MIDSLTIYLLVDFITVLIISILITKYFKDK